MKEPDNLKRLCQRKELLLIFIILIKLLKIRRQKFLDQRLITFQDTLTLFQKLMVRKISLSLDTIILLLERYMPMITMTDSVSQ